MTTTKQSTWGATLRTTILLASLTGLLVVIGALIGGPSTAALFLVFGLVMNLGAYFFSDKLALKMSGAKPIEESEAPRLYQIVRELTTRAGLPMPRLYMIPAGPAERLRHRAQPEALRRGRHRGDHETPLRGRAARRALPRARARQAPRHPDPVGRLGDRRRDHLHRLHADVVRRRRRVAAQPRRVAGARHPGPDRGERSSSSRSRASASSRPTPAAPRSAATRSRSPALCCASSRAPRRCRCRSTRRPSRSTSSGRSRAAASPASSRPTLRSRSGSGGCARCAPACSGSARDCHHPRTSKRRSWRSLAFRRYTF